MRTHDKLRTTLDAYQEACSPPEDLARAAENGGVQDRVTAQGNLLATLARQHRLPAFGDITPRALNPDAFLEAVIVSRDQAVNNSSRLRARQTLTQRKQARSALCLCFPTRGAEDELEFRDWIEEARDGGVAPHSGDPELAGRVRRFAAGGRLVPWVSYKRQDAAVQASIEAEMRRIKGKRQADDGQVTGADDPTIAPFWEMLLSPDLTQHPVKDRLRALAALKQPGLCPTADANHRTPTLQRSTPTK